MRWLSSGLLCLVLGGCFDYRIGRDTIAVGTWDQRGETVGDLVYVYCNRAAPREQLIFRWGMQRTLGPHRVVIICDPDMLLVPPD